MTAVTTQKSYSNDWRRTNPDLVVFLPPAPPYYPEAADHVLVDYTPGGDLLAIWTMGLEPNRKDFNVVYARSMDGGVNWTSPTPIHEPGALGHTSQFGWPVISETGRIYCFYNRTVGIGLPSVANIRCRYSDDDGYTWVDGGVEIPYRRTKWDHPDPDVPAACITWQKPVRDAQGRQIVPLTRTTHPYLKQDLRAMQMGDRPDVGLGECRSEFLRFDNIDEGPDPKDLKLTWLPDDEDLISVLVSFEPHRSKGYSFCQEPGLVLLPDGRLFTAMRTANGQVWYTVSDDDGHSWRETEILRFKDGGDPVLNPIAPTPIFGLEDGRYVLFHQNHDGFGYGGKGPLDLNSRRPQFLSVGEFRDGAHQPLWFSEPLLFADTQKIGIYPFSMHWLSMYASLTERDGQRIFWYTDRKIFVLGRYITDEMLAGLTVPR